MALDRLLPVSTTPGAVTGNNYIDAVQEEVTGLWDRSIIKLTSVSGTNAISAVPVPALTGALVDGMKFELIPVATTTSPFVSLDVGTGAKTVNDSGGIAPVAGAIVLGRSYLLTWNAAANKFYVMSYLPATAFDDRPSFRNVMLDNGGFEVWQRGVALTIPASVTAYTADRWYITTGTGQITTVALFNAGLTSRSRYQGLVQRNPGQTGTSTVVFAYPLTTSECVRLCGAKISLSFLANTGPDWSPTSGTITYNVYFGTGTEGKRGAGFTGETNPITGTINLPPVNSGSVAVTSSGTVATNVTQGEVRLTWTPVGPAGAADVVAFDNFQLESGLVITEFEYAPFHTMLALCQRHYCKTFQYDVPPAQNSGSRLGVLVSPFDGDITTSGVGQAWRFPSPMRIAPTIVTYNPNVANANWRNNANSGDAAATVVTAFTGENGAFIGQTVAGPEYYVIHASADASL